MGRIGIADIADSSLVGGRIVNFVGCRNVALDSRGDYYSRHNKETTSSPVASLSVNTRVLSHLWNSAEHTPMP